MKYTAVYMNTMTTENPNTFKTLTHDGHTTITDWSNCRRTASGRIVWEQSLKKEINICRDGEVRVFEIIEYIKKPSTTAHDSKVRVKNIETGDEFTLWSRDFKQGDIARLFK